MTRSARYTEHAQHRCYFDKLRHCGRATTTTTTRSSIPTSSRTCRFPSLCGRLPRNQPLFRGRRRWCLSRITARSLALLHCAKRGSRCRRCAKAADAVGRRRGRSGQPPTKATEVVVVVVVVSSSFLEQRVSPRLHSLIGWMAQSFRVRGRRLLVADSEVGHKAWDYPTLFQRGKKKKKVKILYEKSRLKELLSHRSFATDR